MTTSAYFIGQQRRLAANVQVSEVDADPGAVTFTMREPDGLITTYVYGTDAQLVKDDAGDYHVDWTIAKAGRHTWSVIGTPPAVGSGRGEFYALRKESGA